VINTLSYEFLQVKIEDSGNDMAPVQVTRGLENTLIQEKCYACQSIKIRRDKV
jgi:hypothetical protein